MEDYTERLREIEEEIEELEKEKSILLAREAGVPEDQILHSEDDLMHFLCD